MFLQLVRSLLFPNYSRDLTEGPIFVQISLVLCYTDFAERVPCYTGFVEESLVITFR